MQVSKVEHAARESKTRPKAWRFGPAQARHDPNPNRARVGPKHVAGRAWVDPSAAGRHGPARF
jgi:hypothetical protein